MAPFGMGSFGSCDMIRASGRILSAECAWEGCRLEEFREKALLMAALAVLLLALVCVWLLVRGLSAAEAERFVDAQRVFAQEGCI